MRKKRKLKLPETKASERSWGVLGMDVSMSSIAGSMIVYDGVLDRVSGPEIHQVRWQKDTPYFHRLNDAARVHDFVHDIMIKCSATPLPLHRVWIGVEEPWPYGIVKRAESGWLKQQAQITGAVLSGLVRYGFVNVAEVNSQTWKNIIREDTGIGKPDKFDIKAWAIKEYDLPDMPDLIKHNKLGMIPRPEGSKAKAVQPQDVYDACGIMAWMERDAIDDLWLDRS